MTEPDAVSLERSSLYENRADFFARMSPIALSIFSFGTFALPSLVSDLALIRLSYAYRRFLQPGGLQMEISGGTAILKGRVKNRHLVSLAEMLAQQIGTVEEVRNETRPAESGPAKAAPPQGYQAVELLLATDRNLSQRVELVAEREQLVVRGGVREEAHRSWAEQLAATAKQQVGNEVRVKEEPSGADRPAQARVDDDSLTALVQLRLHLAGQPDLQGISVKSHAGVVSLEGRVEDEHSRRQAEALARTTLGLRELRSSLLAEN